MIGTEIEQGVASHLVTLDTVSSSFCLVSLFAPCLASAKYARLDKIPAEKGHIEHVWPDPAPCGKEGNIESIV
jgi:hypothetical protein